VGLEQGSVALVLVAVSMEDDDQGWWDGWTYLELVLSGLGLRRWVEEVECENLLRSY